MFRISHHIIERISMILLAPLLLLGAGCLPTTPSDDLSEEETNETTDTETADTGELDITDVTDIETNTDDTHPEANRILSNISGSWELTRQTIERNSASESATMLGATLSIAGNQYTLNWEQGYFDQAACKARYTDVGLPKDSPVSVSDLCAYDCTFPSGSVEQGTIRIVQRASDDPENTGLEGIIFEPDVNSQSAVEPVCVTGVGVAASDLSANLVVLGGQYAWDLYSGDLRSLLTAGSVDDLTLILEESGLGYDRQVVEFVRQ